MTKEELEKEADEYATENYEQCIYDDVIGWKTDYEARKQAYLAGAEPREKRIAALEQQNVELIGKIAFTENKSNNLVKENEELKKEVDLWKKASENNSFKAFQFEKENKELKARNKWYSEQVCNKECAEVWGNLDKAKEIIEKLKALYFYPVITKDDVKRQDEILAEAEQFLKEDSVSEHIQRATHNYTN